MYTSVHSLCTAPFACGVRLINVLQTCGEQRTHGAWKGHPLHPVLFVFVQKNNKFRFSANGMQTIRGWRSAGLQSRPHVRAFSSQTVCEWFANHLAYSYIHGFTCTRLHHTVAVTKFHKLVSVGAVLPIVITHRFSRRITSQQQKL